MDKERKDLLVFGYGLALLIPFLVVWHAAAHKPFGGIFLFFGGIVLCLWLAVSMAQTNPRSQAWLLLLEVLVIGYGFSHKFHLLPMAALGLAFVLATAAVVKIETLKPLYRKWMQGTQIIGNIIMSVILAVFFYLVLGVIGIILRILRKDLLDQKIDLKRDSYWIKRNVPFEKINYTRQF